MGYKDINKQREFQRNWAKARRPELVEKTRMRKRKYKQDAINLLGGKCIKCGYDKCPTALQFHHINPKEKFKGVSKLIDNKGWVLIKKEVLKCILLCANCHAELHYNETFTSQ